MKRELIAKSQCEHKTAGDVMNTNYVICTECHAYISAVDLAHVWTMYHSMVETGIAILIGELDQHRKDLEIASGELMVPIPKLDSEDEKDVHIRTMMRANSLMLRDRDNAKENSVQMTLAANDLNRRLFEIAKNILMVLEEDADPRGLVRKAKAVLQVHK